MFEYLVGLNVVDDGAYQRYRDAITPMLHERGGEFRYDFRVGEVLKSEVDADINRVFVIVFPSEPAAKEFFADPDYLAAKQEHFEAAVRSTTILAEYERS